MSNLRDITMFPNATGKVGMVGGIRRDAAHRVAFEVAIKEFRNKYKRDPDHNILMFRGAHTSVGAICEIWEEEG